MTLKWNVCAVEDLNLNVVEPLQGVPYLAIGKHLCAPLLLRAYTAAVVCPAPLLLLRTMHWRTAAAAYAYARSCC